MKLNVCKTDCIHHWHKVSRHRHAKAIKVMNSKKLVSGLNIKPHDKSDNFGFCTV